MKLYVDDAPENDTLNSKRKRDNLNETTFDDCSTSDMSYQSFNNCRKIFLPDELQNIKKNIGNKQHFNIDNNDQFDDDANNHDTTSSTSCSLHEVNDVSNYYNPSFKNRIKHSSSRKSNVMAAKPTREFLKKCTSKTTKDIEIITYLEHDQSMNKRGIHNDDKYKNDSNKLLPKYFRRESCASSSSTRLLISNNNSPSIIPSKNTLECSYDPNSNIRSSIILENCQLHSNNLDKDFIQECRFDNSKTNFRNNSKEIIHHYKAQCHAENDKFTQI